MTAKVISIKGARSNTRELQKIGQKNATGYRHIEKDPILDQVNRLIKNSGMPISELSYRSGLSRSTFRAWDMGLTRRPQNASIDVCLKTIGKKRIIVDI